MWDETTLDDAEMWCHTKNLDALTCRTEPDHNHGRASWGISPRRPGSPPVAMRPPSSEGDIRIADERVGSEGPVGHRGEIPPVTRALDTVKPAGVGLPIARLV